VLAKKKRVNDKIKSFLRFVFWFLWMAVLSFDLILQRFSWRERDIAVSKMEVLH